MTAVDIVGWVLLATVLVAEHKGRWVERLHCPAFLKASPGQLSDCVSNKREKRNPSERHAPRPNRTIRANAPRSTGHSDRIIHTNPKALKIDSATKPNR